MAQHTGASIIPGSGAVVRHERLTVVAGGPVIQGSEDLGRAALAMIDRLDGANAWGFEAVAAALHQLVLDHEPRGVAAVLADDDGEVLLFAFDRATAQGGENTAAGQGRAGWATEVAEGPAVQLRLDNVPFTPADTDIELRAGMVPGAGAILQVLPVTAIKSDMANPVPPAPSSTPPSSALGAGYLPAAPPPEETRVDSSLLPPPPGEWHPNSVPPDPNPSPPPPSGPATYIPPPPASSPPPPVPTDTESQNKPFFEDAPAPQGPPRQGPPPLRDS